MILNHEDTKKNFTTEVIEEHGEGLDNLGNRAANQRELTQIKSNTMTENTLQYPGTHFAFIRVHSRFASFSCSPCLPVFLSQPKAAGSSPSPSLTSARGGPIVIGHRRSDVSSLGHAAGRRVYLVTGSRIAPLQLSEINPSPIGHGRPRNRGFASPRWLEPRSVPAAVAPATVAIPLS